MGKLALGPVSLAAFLGACVSKGLDEDAHHPVLLAPTEAERNAPREPTGTTALQKEVLEWIAIGNEALKTGVEPAPLNEREAAYRTWQRKWGEAGVLALEDGLRDPQLIKTRVLETARVEERGFIDACVRHGYEVTEVIGFVDFEKGRLTDEVYSWIETYIRTQPNQ